jgi:hypothetical protein
MDREWFANPDQKCMKGVSPIFEFEFEFDLSEMWEIE